MRERQADAHVRARTALAKRVIARAMEWGLGTKFGAILKAANYDFDVLLPYVYTAIAEYPWREGWGDKLSKYQTFGAPQRVIGIYADVPAAVVHDIMCRMRPEKWI